MYGLPFTVCPELVEVFTVSDLNAFYDFQVFYDFNAFDQLTNRRINDLISRPFDLVISDL
ncbi:MAG: hypothetical protein PVH35_09455 [Syntrophobacterales bacterium]